MAVLLLEVNETASYFVEKFSAAGKLPNFARLRTEGATIRTHIPDVDPGHPRFTRQTSPWIVWPSIYTGMRASAHELIGFGQDTTHVMSRYVWDVLAEEGRSYGVFGSLISYPPRAQASFYVPESLASTAECIPKSLEPLQEFFLFGAHHYSESNFASFARAGFDLARAAGRAVSLGATFRAFAQIPWELWSGKRAKADRAMLHSLLVFDAFERLMGKTRPDFATAHFNHIAYYQHRYWRAAEPQFYRRELSSTDRRFFRDVAAREREEARYSKTIEDTYVWTDHLVGRSMDMLADGDILLIASGLGQRPYDPVSEIHNPVVRFQHAEGFFARLGLAGVVVRYEMNPDLTIDCPDETVARRYESLISGLQWDDGSAVFYCQRRRRQLFLELVVPPNIQHNPNAAIFHKSLTNFKELANRYVWQSETNEQSTAHHSEEGLLMAWRKGGRIFTTREDIFVTEIAAAILEIFSIGPREWHHDYRGPLFRN